MHRVILPHPVWLAVEHSYIERMTLWANVKLMARFLPILAARWLFQVEDDVRTNPLYGTTILCFETGDSTSLSILEQAGAKVMPVDDPEVAIRILSDESYGCELVVIRAKTATAQSEEKRVTDKAMDMGVPVLVFTAEAPLGITVARRFAFGTARTEAKLLELAISAARKGAA